jgi:prophage regulatory protein
MAEQILRFRALKEIVGLGRTSIYEKIKEGRFPAPVKLGDRARGWKASEIERWISERETAGRAA